MSADLRRSHPTTADSGVMAGFPPARESRVSLANWQTAPFNRWGFLHTRELIPTANVSRGEGNVWRLERGTGGLGATEIQGLPGTRTLGEFLDDSWTDGMIVLHRGRIELEAYRNAMQPGTRHVAMSVSKSITSLLIGTLVGHGLIDPRTLVTSVVPELADTAYHGATIQHVLDMQVANAWREDYVGEDSEYWRLDVAAGWLPPREGAAGTLFDFMKASRREGNHGERIQYSSLNTDVLGLVAERAAGAHVAELASTLLWQPAGMEFDADLTLDRGGSAAVDGGFCITLRDMARIGQLFLNGGRANGIQVVPAEWITSCRQPRPMPFDPSSYGIELGGALYRNQWWLLDGRSFALGIHGQMIAIDVEAEVVVGFLSSAPEPNDHEQRRAQRRIVKDVVRRISDPDAVD
jgi:CubicO group peptidase (beta-lactamase class C family)